MFSLAKIAEITGAELVDCEDPELVITAITPIHEAKAGAVTFLNDAKYDGLLEACPAAVICAERYRSRPHSAPLLLAKQPYVAFAKLMQAWFIKEPEWTGVHERAWVDPTAEVAEPVVIGPHVSIGKGAKVGRKVVIHPGCVIGEGAVIGDGTVLHANVTVYKGCEVGRGCIIHSGTVIGSDGFGFAPDLTRGVHEKIPQVGIVIIEDGVEVGANAAIDRAALGVTRIGAGTKIDNLVQIAHNVEVGKGCFIVSQAGIAGSAKLGNFVTLAGQVGIVGHIELGDGVMVGAQSGVGKSLPPGSKVLGTPAQPGALAKRMIAAAVRAPELRKEVKALGREVAELRARLEAGS